MSPSGPHWHSVLRKRFRGPSDRARVLSNIPWRAAVSLAILGAVVCPARFLWWRVKVDVADVNPRSQRHAERLNSAVEVLVINGVFVMPHTGTWVSHFVTHKPNPVVAWIGFGLVTVAPVQAMMAGCICIVEPTGENVKLAGPPPTENWR